MSEEGTVYTFTGYATVSVTTTVEASSEKEAMSMIERGDCEWKCEEVDGDVEDLELVSAE